MQEQEPEPEQEQDKEQDKKQDKEQEQEHVHSTLSFDSVSHQGMGRNKWIGLWKRTADTKNVLILLFA